MDTPTRRMTRSSVKKKSPDIVKKPTLYFKQKFISLDMPTPKKYSNYEKNRNAHNEESRQQMGSFSSKKLQKNENVDKPISDKVAQSCSSKKINQSASDFGMQQSLIGLNQDPA
ncbi:Uncharacterized protein Fot_10754 [Forsythia ovata]|uniref:Uncharacterized protein n=1 Tax=Forsythia ovata TaxID=205694 RepID=A0ABD1WHR1_9LAMI